jgi:5-methylcytosine-specific restriction endonuclease McrA
MDKRRDRFEAHRWVQGHIGESLTTASVEELERLAGYLAYKIKHGHCPLHEDDNSKIRYKKNGGSQIARLHIREKLVEMFGEKCAECGKSGIPLTLDHIKPISLGGKNELGNTQLLCVPCHTKKTRGDSRIAYRKFFAEKFPEKLEKRRANAHARKLTLGGKASAAEQPTKRRA